LNTQLRVALGMTTTGTVLFFTPWWIMTIRDVLIPQSELLDSPYAAMFFSLVLGIVLIMGSSVMWGRGRARLREEWQASGATTSVPVVLRAWPIATYIIGFLALLLAPSWIRDLVGL
jgi:hypothetical protein